MRKSSITADHGGKLVLKSVKLTQPLVKPEIKEAVISSIETEVNPKKRTIIAQLIEKIKINKR
ncbi:MULTISPECIES: hypothetical protein [Chryseobacterium]|uniref:Uncharacterized protein n=1 Tax=Chryseobacterium cucumeris TaxID=1813611 RepID=A0ABX9X724_9FLAO|nr:MULTISPECIES: hypothetical protein [Chryseobacterium]MDH5032414.1 hypothetical protein [Chryseobacterium cucumeris]ROH90690.1 hypothetical protein EGI15_18700 [Chryseobacterium cucumeris]TXI96063.1 MAG: hypothetical protein E6Q35_08565 [Chryseobacterium cucumeris]WFB69368.1 hypothetical protein PZ898_08050 [Chryseobacterium sp. WX]